eukprot:TRINITY_DN9461_c0_g1_i1.p1 TRINITY_DN9461_c0_g1~~TRINITY_DN9461_c0_g1_i1.p1  ORF type:complete len:776 (+),score=186.07 TRINITY_DN9461_c0_g1_i1:79-2406(+)
MEDRNFINEEEEETEAPEIDGEEGFTLSYVGEAAKAALWKKHFTHYRTCWNVTKGKIVGDIAQSPGKDTWGMEEPPDDHSSFFPKRMYDVIVRAQEFVDFTSLSPPDGEFLETIQNALRDLYDNSKANGNKVVVRILFGNLPGMPCDCNKLIKSFTENIEYEEDDDPPLKLWVGAWRKGTSWNHSKIIAVDGKYLFTGGHNVWDPHYLRRNPVHDLSFECEGDCAMDGHYFANEMWKFIIKTDKGLFFNFVPDWVPWLTETRVTIGNWPGGIGDHPPIYSVPYNMDKAQDAVKALLHGGEVTGDEASDGIVPMITCGRYGALHKCSATANPSDSAIIAMLGSAQEIIRMSLQDLGPPAIPMPGGGIRGIPGSRWPHEYLKPIGIAIYDRGVDVEIVLSQPSSCPGDCNPLMANYGNGWTATDVASEIIQAIQQARPDADDEKLRQTVRENLRVTFLKVSKDIDTWPDGARIGNHAKFFMIDDKGYYIGSQNLYIANLGEWGVFVDSEEATKQMREEYWDPMWEYSFRPDMNEVDVDLVMDSMGVQRDADSLDEADLDTKKEMLKTLLKSYKQTGDGAPNSKDLAELARRCGLSEDDAAAAFDEQGLEFQKTQYSWVKFQRGDALPPGAVKAGETESDGPVYVARNLQGECGKLNMDGDTIWNLWCHSGGESQEGQIFCLKNEDAVIEWKPCAKGDRIPEGAVYAGHTCSDGRVYVARVETGACGKVNVSGGHLHNFWVHEGGMADQIFGPKGKYTEGEVLCIDPMQTPEGRNIGE